MPNLRSLARLRPLLPYAARLLPILTGIAAPASLTGDRPEAGVLDHHFAEIQSESRGLRTRVEDQGEQLSRMAQQLEQITAALEHSESERAALTASFNGFSRLVRGLFFATLSLLVAVTVLSVLILLRISHLS